MDFDEYEYLEKSVEESENRSKKKSSEKRERDVDDGRVKERDIDTADDGHSRKKSRRSDGENGGGERKRDDRDRDRDRRREKDKDKDRERERSKDRDRREKERERERRDRDREKERRDRERSKEKEREKSRERERERSRRSSSRSRRHESRERELREAEIRDSRRFKEKKEAVEPEADPERDQRTVFAYQMPLKAAERDVYEFFSKAGKVRDVRLIMDRNSRRSKGVGYIEFYDVMSVPMAIAMSGQLFLGQPVMVKPSEAEKNLVQSTASTGSSVTGPYGPTDRKLYVGNLHFNMTEQQLRQIFESFGPIELVQLPLDPESGHCKGFGFVQFAQVEHAKQAVSLNGKLDIAGRYIKVSSVTEHVGAAQEAGTTAADFDDDDGGGLALNARSRAMLMAKLDRTGTASSIAGSLGVPLNGAAPVQQPFALPLNGQAVPTIPGQLVPPIVSEPIGTPSECLLLKNLFDPATETDPEFDLDIKEDVEEECSKFGRVRHIYVDKHSAGHVYLRYENKEDAMKAQQGMHMRWFARRLISAIFMQPQDYEAKFQDGA
ncbi:uncharacterized protein LOC141586840 [Silene latifolia]|uniref:uncharacterized protein LOC141586840 n=1 Tax=Silene latifolia TaxID=37657 RepID=UPI003D77555E